MTATRIRERGGFTRSGTWKKENWNQTKTSPGTVSNYTTSSVATSQMYGGLDRATDVVTPNFRGLRAEGRITNNPATFTKESKDHGDGSIEMWASLDSTRNQWLRYTGDWIRHNYGYPSTVFVEDSVLISQMKDKAATTAWSKVAGPEVEGLVFAAEISETIRMLLNPLQGLTRFISDSKKWRRAAGSSENIRGSSRTQYRDQNRSLIDTLLEGGNAAAACWLEARMGWRPFLLEMDKILDTLREADFAPRHTARGFESRTVTSSSDVIGARGSQFNLLLDYTETRLTEYSVRTGVLYDFRHSMSSNFGFRWRDLPSAVYEAIPFSFVLDWFINLGTFIKALSPKTDARTLAVWETVRAKHTITRTYRNPRLSGWTVTNAVLGGAMYTFESYTRTPKINPPSLTFTYDLKSALDFNRVWDAIALITQLFSSKGKVAFN